MMHPKKSPPMAKNSRRLQRPYPKADITIEDQQRAQMKLLSAGKTFQGYNRLNLDIIAISFEHKCFSEAKNRDEYIAKIRSKLIEWKYVPEDDVDEDGPLKLKLPPNPPPQQHSPQLQQQQHQQKHQQQRTVSPPQPQLINNKQLPQKQNDSHTHTNHQRHHSGPALIPHIKTNGSPAPSPSSDANASPPSSQSYDHTQATFFQTPVAPLTLQAPFQPQISHQGQAKQSQFCHRNTDVQQGDPPQSQVRFGPEGRRLSTSYQSVSPQHSPQQRKSKSPKSQPMSHSVTTMSSSSSGSSTEGGFVDYFDPKFLKDINLNDPEIRALWVSAVWDFFQSGGQWTGYTFKTPQNSQERVGNFVPQSPIYHPAFSGNTNGLGGAKRNANTNGNGNGNNIMGSPEMQQRNGNAEMGRLLEGRLAGRQMGPLAEVPGSRVTGANIRTDGQWISASMDMVDMGMSNMDGVLNGDLDMNPMSPGTFEKWLLQ